MIEIQARLRCERCDNSIQVVVTVEEWDSPRCDIPDGWVEETRERRKGNVITEIKMHFCAACAVEIESWNR